MKTRMLSLLIWLPAFSSQAQTALDNYITEGLGSNESIKQQQFILEKNIAALEEARTLFLPTVNLGATYTLAGGGRTVDFPAGDILNPVYTTLNQLTASNNFPKVENQRILLNPHNFYDVRFRTSAPVINHEIRYNLRIKKQQVHLQEIEINLYRRELVKEIKTAYFKYLQAKEAIAIYETAVQLAQENLRVNNSLFKNAKVNRTAVVRSEAELTKYQSLLETARQNENSAQSLFNFLINKPLETAIKTDSIYRAPDNTVLLDTTVDNREELLKLSTAAAINENLKNLTSSLVRPKVSAFLDLGSQAFNWKVNGRSAYYFFGISLSWDIFTAGRNKYRLKQVEADRATLDAQTKYAEDQLQLQLKVVHNAFISSVSQYRSSLAQQAVAEKYYKDMLKMYKEGMAIFIELLDAQNQVITTRLQTNIALYDTWIKAAETERANAGFSLPQN